MKVSETPLVGTITAANGVPNFRNTGFSVIASLDTLDKTNEPKKHDYLNIQTIYEKETGISTNPLLDKIVENTTNSFPYSHMADENNMINYKGATFVGDSETNTLCLGDMSVEENILSSPLSDGGTLRVNRNNIGQLAKAIDMFAPADINRIMKAISTDAKVQQKENEIEAMKMAPFLEEKVE